MTAQEAFEELVRGGVWPFLEEHAFKRTAARFHRPVGRNWEVISLQKSQWSDRTSVRFTVNLAVGIDRLRQGVHDWSEGKRPIESRCHLRERLGLLLRGDDVWWEVDSRTDIRNLGESINTALERYALPWLGARSSDEMLLALMRSQEQRQAEPIHHLYWIEKLAALLGEEALARAVAADRRKKETEVELRRSR